MFCFSTLSSPGACLCTRVDSLWVVVKQIVDILLFTYLIQWTGECGESEIYYNVVHKPHRLWSSSFKSLKFGMYILGDYRSSLKATDWPVGLPLPAQCVCHCLSGLSSGFYRAGGGRPSKHETLTWCWASRVLANINPALVQSIALVYATQAHYWPGISSMPGHCMRNKNEQLTGIRSVSAVVLAAAVCTARPACYWTQPSKHEMLNQGWFDAGPAAQTVGQHWTSIGLASHVCW